MSEPTPEVPEIHQSHSGEMKIVWPDPSVEPKWNSQRVRAVALELAIKTAEDRKNSLALSLDSISGQVIALADRYQAFIAGEDADA